MQTKYTIVSLDGKKDEELHAIAQELGMKDIPSGRDRLIYAILDFQAELQAEVGKDQGRPKSDRSNTKRSDTNNTNTTEGKSSSQPKERDRANNPRGAAKTSSNTPSAPKQKSLFSPDMDDEARKKAIEAASAESASHLAGNTKQRVRQSTLLSFLLAQSQKKLPQPSKTRIITPRALQPSSPKLRHPKPPKERLLRTSLRKWYLPMPMLKTRYSTLLCH